MLKTHHGPGVFLAIVAMLAGVLGSGADGGAAESGAPAGEDALTVDQLLDRESARTEPDYVVYRPGSVDGSTFDTGNEHFLVFDGPDASLMAVWTQSSYEGKGDHRIMFSRSEDEGVSWSAPLRIVGPARPGDGFMSSWGFPLVSKSGRIYVLWNQYQGIDDVIHQHTGTMDGCYSDDMGRTWSKPQTIPMTRSPHDHTDPNVPSNWIVWQKPIRDLENKWFTGFSRWVSKAVRTQPHINSWTAWETVVEFMRFENIDDNPEPNDIQITYSAWGDQALRVPHYDNPALSIAQEPSLVRLPDDRLFCVMRTMSGYIWYSLSSDDGRTWCSPRPLLRRDHGLPIPEPLCCCPIYEYAPGRYVLLHHNNDGHFEGSKREETGKNRRPACLALGEYRPGAEQPIWFSESKVFFDNGGVGIGPLTRIDCGVYPSVTNRNGQVVLWHPDRKFFLLGKKITADWLATLTVPER
ncbi:MAG TPA: sialidase family protein [Candidatus Hydrogenedentes bacterium]|nr:exo-alpha-sialidase [Candidatus Hydrogenedentota bacterium]HNZ18165.1 sialidase family protein [Candidatus Hydrogenedentota bacterium]HOH32505.1 sialidase family protein [Candidatus Hydrogenedentota bacterium]HPA02851.1 sialidase family protein [Candidatus Hydrogenedentota bacterium]HPV37080.1 sialidase family protein [Candidatus Hydrogenedentota bacterium]